MPTVQRSSVPKDSLAATAALEQARTKSKLRDIFVDMDWIYISQDSSHRQDTVPNVILYVIYIYI